MAIFGYCENEDKVAEAIVSFATSVKRFVDLLERLEKLALKEIEKNKRK
jgi:hypothetical protein